MACSRRSPLSTPGSARLRGIPRHLSIALIATFALSAHAQDASPANVPADEDRAAAAATGDLGTVRVIGEYRPPVDPFAFKNPIDIQGSAFDKHYREPPTPEEISLNGGYILYGINYGLMKAMQQVTRLPGWKHQIQPATARPPPLDEEQMQRAMRVMEAQER